MNLFIDCEWNSFGGELISMALVSETGYSFYEVTDYSNLNLAPWIVDHVIPILNKEPVSREVFTEKLHAFLAQFDHVHIIADWPEDLMWFCKVLITGPGTRIATPTLTMQIIRVDSLSELPHNALEDAKGLRKHILSWRTE